jgi:GDP-mannose transporter
VGRASEPLKPRHAPPACRQQCSQTVAVVAIYCCCSSMMLIVNKLAVHHVGAPAFVTWLQVRPDVPPVPSPRPTKNIPWPPAATAAHPHTPSPPHHSPHPTRNPQFAATAGTVKLASLLRLIEVDPFEWSKVKYFAIYVLAFSGGTWSNMKARTGPHSRSVTISPVEAHIPVRSSHSQSEPTCLVGAGRSLLHSGHTPQRTLIPTLPVTLRLA